MWPDTVVEESNLVQHISLLRKALHDQRTEHQFIVTVPGRGYRFVADVREVGGRQDVPAVAPRQRSPLDGQRPVSRVWMVLPIAVVAVVLAFLAVRVSLRSGATEPPQRTLWQLTFDPGLESEPTWSPDGRWLAYSSDRGGSADIWVHPIGRGNPVRVTASPADDGQPDWSPDGQRIAFRSERDGGGLFVVPAFGGAERKVADFGYRPRWSPDGAQILFVSSVLQQVREAPKVYVVDLNGSPPRAVLTDRESVPFPGFGRSTRGTRYARGRIAPEVEPLAGAILAGQPLGQFQCD